MGHPGGKLRWARAATSAESTPPLNRTMTGGAGISGRAAECNSVEAKALVGDPSVLLIVSRNLQRT